MQEYTINPNKILREQWMTPGLMKCTMKQRKLYKKTLNNSSEKDHEKYKEYRNCLKKLLRKTKQEYYKEKCAEFKRNTRKLLNMVNTIISKHNDKSNSIEYLKVGNIDIYNAKEIANHLGNTFPQLERIMPIRYHHANNHHTITLKKSQEIDLPSS